MIDHDFSLMRGGPTYRFVRAIARLAPAVSPSWLMAAVMFVLSFVPLAVLAWRDGTLLPGRVAIPLAGDYFVLARFAVAMPLLVLAARASDDLLRRAMWQFLHGGVVPRGRLPEFEHVLGRARRARDSFLPEFLCLVLAVAPILLPRFTSEVTGGGLQDLVTWQYEPDGGATPANVWMNLVSAPLFRFLVLLWLWRLLLWSWLLWRFSRMHPDLRPTHPDRAGGLGFMGRAQCRFAILSVAGAVVICGYCLNLMAYAGEPARDMRHLVAGYVVASTLVLLMPLLLMSTAMVRAKREGLVKYGVLGHAVASDFDGRWRLADATADAAARESMLESPHPSAQADFGAVHDNVASMSIVPVTRWNVLLFVAAALAPFAPIAFFAMSLDELAQQIFHILV